MSFASEIIYLALGRIMGFVLAIIIVVAVGFVVYSIK